MSASGLRVFLRSRRRGFSLIELAITLGIISLIVAGIYEVYGKMAQQNLLNQATDEVSLIANNVRSYYSGQQLPSPAACPPPLASAGISATTGIFPSEMLHTVAGVPVANNAWNRGSGAATALAYVCGASPNQRVVIRDTNVTAQACIALVMRTSALASGANLKQIIVTIGGVAAPALNTDPFNGGSVNGTVSLANATTTCSADGATIDWYYTLSG